MTETNDPEYELVLVDSTDPRFPDVMDIRHRVFVEEQRVDPVEEWDEWDALATHILLLKNGQAVGTLRFFDDDGWLHVGRFAIVSDQRGSGLGRVLLHRCLEEGKNLGLARSFLNAQSDKVGFYGKFGYTAVGDEFMEAGIPHRRMELAP